MPEKNPAMRKKSALQSKLAKKPANPVALPKKAKTLTETWNSLPRGGQKKFIETAKNMPVEKIEKTISALQKEGAKNGRLRTAQMLLAVKRKLEKSKAKTAAPAGAAKAAKTTQSNIKNLKKKLDAAKAKQKQESPAGQQQGKRPNRRSFLKTVFGIGAAGAVGGAAGYGGFKKGYATGFFEGTAEKPVLASQKKIRELKRNIVANPEFWAEKSFGLKYKDMRMINNAAARGILEKNLSISPQVIVDAFQEIQKAFIEIPSKPGNEMAKALREQMVPDSAANYIFIHWPEFRQIIGKMDKR